MSAGSLRRSVTVYDAFWPTAGGGEAYAAGVAETLAVDHEVTLLAHEPVDPLWLGERLGFDLRGVSVRVVPITEPLEAVTAADDLLVNASYRNHGRSGACHGLYVVHFPDHPGGSLRPWQRWLSTCSRADGTGSVGGLSVSVVRGFHEPDVIRWQEVRWTDGSGVLRVGTDGRGAGRAEAPCLVHLWFGRFLPGGVARDLTIEVGGAVVAHAELGPPRSKLEVVEPLRVDVEIPAGSDPCELRILSDAVVADDVLGNGDRRVLGVPLVAVTTGRRLGSAVRARASLVGAEPPGVGYLDSYDRVVANSRYTQRWVTRWWDRPSDVLEPPVSLRQPGAKEPIILSVGRFFAPGRGHAKKQLELVQAFRQVNERVRGWELHLLGGCSPEDRHYLDEVQAEAGGLPVVFHVDASGPELVDLYARASLYWQATGLGEDLDADPVRAEHFGIAVVEAMSAGAVPVVLDEGGPVEIVRPGIDGAWFRDGRALVETTVMLIGDADRRAAMSRSAIARSEAYGRERFAGRLRGLIADVTGWDVTAS